MAITLKWPILTVTPPVVAQSKFSGITGTMDICNIIHFAELLYAKYQNKIEDVIGSNVIEEVVLGAKRKKLKLKKDPFIEKAVIENQVSSYFGPDPVGEDSLYTRIQIPLLEVGQDEDIIAAIAAQIIPRAVPYQMHAKPSSIEEAYEIIAVEAMENFCNPTHVVYVNPNLIIALDIEDFKIEIIDHHGTIRMAVYTDRVSSYKALEVSNVKR